MIEPETPVTLKVQCSFHPAFLLASDEGQPLPASSVILRHRHLRQQQRTIQRGVAVGEGPGPRPTRGIVVAAAGPREPVPAAAEPVNPPVTPSVAPAVPPPPPPPAQERVGSPAAPPTNPVVDGGQGGTTSGMAQRTSVSPNVRITRSHLRLDDSARDLRQNVVTSIGPLEIIYTWRGLRSRGEKTRGEKTTWFASSANQLLDIPPTLSLAKAGDLYVHTGKNGLLQAWLRTTTQTWQSVDLFHPHPYLRGYVLNFLKNGEPSWITKDTVRTYKGRIEKRARDAKKSSV